ncbi:hypothetical protein, partial [Streptacidiphilus sp. MAP5-3]|uniref:RICIN domain-containing protein n=1 Tax=unclassified Streptacidiphilus TaxID=2643834 RepID=UPI00351801BD
MRKLTVAAVGGVALIGSLGLGVSSASASTVSAKAVGHQMQPYAANGTWVLTSVATGKCIDDSNYGLRDFGCQDQNGPYAGFQQFRIMGQPNGTDVLQSVATGKCVDDSSYGLRDFGCQDQNGPYAAFQQFTMFLEPNGSVVLQSVATGKCVDDSSYGLRDFGCQDQNGPYA